MSVEKNIQREIEYLKLEKRKLSELIDVLQDLKIEVGLKATSRANIPVKRQHYDNRKELFDKINLLLDFDASNFEIAKILGLPNGTVGHWKARAILCQT